MANIKVERAREREKERRERASARKRERAQERDLVMPACKTPTTGIWQNALFRILQRGTAGHKQTHPDTQTSESHGHTPTQRETHIET
jgi:hypothetical protein